MKLIGKGIFGWEGNERRSNRYGALHLSDRPFEGSDRVKVFYDNQALVSLMGRKVRLVVKVVESRVSSHIGDRDLNIFPSQPAVGEEIDLGVGRLAVAESFDENPYIILRPEDGRKVFWIDPHKLYRLHDQTVEIYAEETDAPCTPKVDLKADNSSSAYSHDDGSLQFKNVEAGETVTVVPLVERLGDGMIRITLIQPPGVKMKVKKPS